MNFYIRNFGVHKIFNTAVFREAFNVKLERDNLIYSLN